MAAELVVAGEWRQPSFLLVAGEGRQPSFLLHLLSQVLPFSPILWPGFDLLSICSLAVIASYHIMDTTSAVEVSANMKPPSLACGNNSISCWCCHSDNATFGGLGQVWTHWYHSQEQLLAGSCWSSIYANSMVTRHSIFPTFKLVRKKSWCQYQTDME